MFTSIPLVPRTRYQEAPLLAVEVRSDGDYGEAAEATLARKRTDYFAAGTLVVWDVDLIGPDAIPVERSDAPAGLPSGRNGRCRARRQRLAVSRANVCVAPQSRLS